ncbi:MAG: CPBP family intramembrane metalloprotease [Dysgonamonadaceae bacterium]|jgi:membrane protease YdiL (CAAX protease family)|nr:CPBP family intramembrane metalloprotease [Dysgonamonadaceae bacterium]
MKFLERSLDGQNQFWKYVIVCLGGFLGGQLLGSIPLVIVLIAKTIVHHGSAAIQPENVMNLSAWGISKNLALFLALFSTVVSLFFTVYLIKILHRRTFSESINGTGKLRIGRIGSGALVWTLLMAIYLVIDYSLNPGEYVLQLHWEKLVVLTILSLLMIPLQTTSEELLFRGYLTQGVAAWTKNRWTAILIPGVLFGLMHITNPEVKEFGFWLSMPQYIFFGLLFGLISVLDDGIELAMGIHAANNIFLSIFTTHASSALQTDALFELQSIDPLKELIVLVASGLIVLGYFAVRYQWNFGALHQKVETQIIEN